MNDFFRMITSIVMWVILGSISFAMIITADGSMNLGEVAIIFIALGIAGFGTAALWSPQMFADGDSASKQVQDESVQKAKRSADNKLSMLLEMMDEDEREAFKATLKRRVLGEMRLSEDGELPSDADTLWDEASNLNYSKR